MEAVGKITLKSLGIPACIEVEIKENSKKQKVAVAQDIDANKFLARVTGIATSTKTGISTYGEWTAFIGQFEATNVHTGETQRSGKLILPPVANNLLLGAVQSAHGPVEFGFDIGVKGNVESAVGYEWTCRPVMEIAENDPIKLLQAKMANAPALPAPTKKAETVEDQPTKEEPKPETPQPAETKKSSKK